MSKIVDVAAAVLLRQGAQGSEFLLAQRPSGKVYAGYWEFPGGKLELGETWRQALVRELDEELGITLTADDAVLPWLCKTFSYPHATVRLKFFRVTSWSGSLQAREKQAFAWTRLGEASRVAPILPANDSILRALELPTVYAITQASERGVSAELARLSAALAQGLKLIQLREKGLGATELLHFATEVKKRVGAYPDARLLINDDETLAHQLGAHGVHLSATRLLRTQQRPDFAWVAASCHNEAELAHAAALGLDFVVLGAVCPTPTHAQASGIGWPAFAQLIESSPLPVFALGGMRREDLATAQTQGAHGIAMMRGWGDQAAGRTAAAAAAAESVNT
ncbi:MAG: Nudix family hydrolase [Pseudomonadota bacterium]